MREITTHKVNGCNEALRVRATDEPGSGGAYHRYEVGGFDAGRNPSCDRESYVGVQILFQNGPIPEVGTNGLTHEALLAILIDRLQGFQKGKFACRENAIALTKLEEAMHWLKHRTEQRLARGVEGTHSV